MKAHRLMATVLAFALVCAAHAYGQQTAQELYQAGLYQEDVRGDLDRAIELYRQIVAQHADVRAVAEKVLLQLGSC
jgi:outer membrane protein assembly factor BamD (BamD/ComL family)